MTTSEAYETLKEAIQADYEYAWAWHCQIAVAALDEGVEHGEAQSLAARAMRTLFQVDTFSGPPDNSTDSTLEPDPTSDPAPAPAPEEAP